MSLNSSLFLWDKLLGQRIFTFSRLSIHIPKRPYRVAEPADNAHQWSQGHLPQLLVLISSREKQVRKITATRKHQVRDPHSYASHSLQYFFFLGILLFCHYHLSPLPPLPTSLPSPHNHLTVVHVHKSFFFFAQSLHSSWVLRSSVSQVGAWYGHLLPRPAVS